MRKKILNYGQQIVALKDKWASTDYTSSSLHLHSHSVGKLAECVFADRVLGSLDYVNWNVTLEGDECDFFFNNYRVDVKCTSYYEDPWLTLNNSCKNKKQDIFVLLALKPFVKKIKLVGFISQEKAMQQKYLNSRKTKFVIPGAKLSTDWDLLKIYLGIT